MDVHGVNGDPFHVLAYYTTTSSQSQSCTGRMACVPQKKSSEKEGAIPPIAVGDLLPPPPNGTVVDVFNDADTDVLGEIEEGNPDEEPCHPQVPMEKEVHAIRGKKEKKPCTKSPIKTKWIVPLVHGAISQTPNFSSKEIILLLQPYIIDIFLTTALIQKV